jgi:mitotic spindle assembly checkpoint protein MAD1
LHDAELIRRDRIDREKEQRIHALQMKMNTLLEAEEQRVKNRSEERRKEMEKHRLLAEELESFRRENTNLQTRLIELEARAAKLKEASERAKELTFALENAGNNPFLHKKPDTSEIAVNTKVETEAAGVQTEELGVATMNDVSAKNEDSDQAKFRVFHLIDNPLAFTRKSKLEKYVVKLELENKHLQERLSLLSAEANTADDATKDKSNADSADTSMESTPSDSLTVQRLHERVTETEKNVIEAREESQSWKSKYEEEVKAYERIKSVFHAKVTEFREACYRVLGWKVEMVGATYKFRSMYAELEDDVILFNKNQDTTIDLIDSAGIEKLDPDVLNLLERTKSFPLFMGTVTSEWFQKQTRVT